MLSAFPHVSPCSSIWKKPQCAQVSVTCSVLVCACLGTKLRPCVCLFARLCDLPLCRFRCELVWCMGLHVCVACTVAALLFLWGRGFRKMCACSCRSACLCLRVALSVCLLGHVPRHMHMYAYAHSHGSPTHLLWQACCPTLHPFGRMTGSFHIAQVSWPLLFS